MRTSLLAISMILILLVAHPAKAEPSGPGPAPTAVRAYLRDAFDATGLPGMSAVVTKDDKIVEAAGFGKESTGRSVTAETPMRVASVSKSFTAATVLTLVDEGRLDLDTPVSRYLTEFRMADSRAKRVTVRQLLNQTSGLSDTTVDIGATQRAGTLAEYVAALRPGRLAADPGARWEYCNVNYDVAARLVEVVDHRTFADTVQARVFRPLGMTASVVGGRPSDGFNSVFGIWVHRAELPGFERGGAGDVVTTAADMGRWLISQAGHGPQVLTPASLKVMHEPSAVHDYGMGWGLETVDGHSLLVHAGNLFTYTAVEAVDPSTGYGFAVLANSASLLDETYDILRGLVALADGKTPATPGGGRQRIELGLGLAGLAALTLSVLGVVRARRWARRRAEGRGWWTALRLVPGLLPVLVLATYPQWVSFLMNGRAVTWAQMTYYAAPLTITLILAALAGLATVVTRLWTIKPTAGAQVTDAV
jgi:CubicO group peptidase (beta-lactamase class C family)